MTPGEPASAGFADVAGGFILRRPPPSKIVPDTSKPGTPLTRRSLLGLAGIAATVGTACAAPWPRPIDRLRVVAQPTPAPARVAPPVLHVVLAQEGLASLDDTVRQATADAARQVGLSADVQDLAAFLARAEGGTDQLAHRLLATVQAGVPPHALLLLGRQAQTARLHAMDLVQDVSGLLRTSRQRYGNVAPVTEVWHVVAGNWFAVPYYQRLIGHWLRAERVGETGLDLSGDVAFEQLAQALTLTPGVAGAGRQEQAPAGAFWPWGIGAADTADVDAWCWDVIHAFGGALADRAGERVQLDTAETIAALDWLRQTFAALALREWLPPAAGQWADEEKNAAFLAGSTAYTFSDRLLGPASSAGNAGSPGSAGASAPVYLPGPTGPVNRPRAIGGGAAWYVPRGASAPLVEQLLERLLALPAQQALWQRGGGFALPAFESGWNDPAAGVARNDANVNRYYQELTNGGFASATGNAGPETAASQAVAEGRLATAMLRAVVGGQPVAAVVAHAQASAAGVFKDFGLPG